VDEDTDQSPVPDGEVREGKRKRGEGRGGEIEEVMQ
jgi:hypothetical protein